MNSIKVKTNVNHPFDWMAENEWMWMAEMTNNAAYTYMDDLYRVMDGTISKEDFEEDWGCVQDFKQEYRERFPELIAACLENLANEIRKKGIEFEIDFNC